MKGSLRYLLVFAVVLCSLLSCGRKARIIPEKKMASIYAEMFLADQWVQDDMSRRKKADTSDFYGTIFKDYGYSFKDYDASVNYYLANPEKYVKVMELAVEKLSKKLAPMQEERDREADLKAFMRSFPEFEKIDFSKDTILKLHLPWDFDETDTAAIDTALVDSVAIDSVAVDSVLVDSLALDSLAVDSVKVDTVVEKPAPAKPVAKDLGEPKKIEKNDVKGKNSLRANPVKATR